MNKYFLLGLLLSATLCFYVQPSALAQTTPQSLRIQLSYEKPGHHLEIAVKTIEAVNTISKDNSVTYQAGNSVTLLPGFQARTGSVFAAIIRPVSFEGEVALQLKAFPNPFEQSTTISYYLPNDGKVNLWVTDVQGKIIGQLVRDENQSAGQHSMEWSPASLSEGVYIPVLEANQKRAVSRIIKK